MVALPFCADSIAAVFKLDPSEGPWVRVRTRDVFSRTIGLANLRTIDTEPSSFIRSKYMQAAPKFKNSARGPDHKFLASPVPNLWKRV